MGYYMAGDYYYQAGGIFGSIGKFIGGVTGIASKVLPGPLGAAAGAISRVVTPKKQQMATAAPIPIMTTPTLIPATGGSVQRTPGLTGLAQRIVPGGATGYEYVGGRRKRINPANPKALRRAIRRQAGFVKLARRALKGTGYTIVSRGSRKRSLSISEHGPGSVNVRGR